MARVFTLANVQRTARAVDPAPHGYWTARWGYRYLNDQLAVEKDTSVIVLGNPYHMDKVEDVGVRLECLGLEVDVVYEYGTAKILVRKGDLI